MEKLHWEKVYHGPFDKKEADALALGIKVVANPEMNLIHDSRVRRRQRSQQYDVYIKTPKEY